MGGIAAFNRADNDGNMVRVLDLFRLELVAVAGWGISTSLKRLSTCAKRTLFFVNSSAKLMRLDDDQCRSAVSPTSPRKRSPSWPAFMSRGVVSGSACC